MWIFFSSYFWIQRYVLFKSQFVYSSHTYLSTWASIRITPALKHCWSVIMVYFYKICSSADVTTSRGKCVCFQTKSTFVSRTMLVSAFQKTILLMPIFEKQTPPQKTPKIKQKTSVSVPIIRCMVVGDRDYHWITWGL